MYGEDELASGGGARAEASLGLRCMARRVVLYLVLTLLVLTYIVPFLWMLSSSLKTDPQIDTIPPIWIPRPMRWENYPEALKYMPWGTYLFNTVVRYTVPSVIGKVVSAAIVAYGFARIPWRGRETVFFLCIATMMIPGAVTMIPMFVVYRKLGWLNTYLPMVVPAWFGSAYNIFMLRQFLRTIPEELSDAARIDGCSELGILARVIGPLMKPGLAVVALFAFVGCWSDYMGPLIYINASRDFPIALALESMAQTLGAHGALKNTMPYMMAISTLVVMPVLVLFFLAQRTFIEGIAITGLKG